MFLIFATMGHPIGGRFEDSVYELGTCHPWRRDKLHFSPKGNLSLRYLDNRFSLLSRAPALKQGRPEASPPPSYHHP